MNIPTDYASVLTYDLLQAASRGLIGLDRRFVHALVDNPAASVPDMLRFGLEDHRDDPVDLEPDLLGAFRLLKSGDALPFYIKTLRSQTEGADDDLIEALIELGPASLEPLLELYHELGEEEGGEVAFILAGLGIHDRRILDLLLERLEYDAADGALCLGLYGDPEAIPAIEKIIADEADAELVRELREAIEEIRSHGPHKAEPAGEFDLFDRYPAEAGPDFDSILDSDRVLLLSHESPGIRAAAARSFFQQEFALDVRARLLEVARNDSDAAVRGRAWEALSGIDDTHLRADLLRIATAAETPIDERAGALVALAEDLEKPELRAAVLELYEHPEARAKALEAMWRSFDREFSKFFPPHVDDADVDVRRQAIIGIGYLGIGAEADRLRQYFDNEDWRADALFAYALSFPAEISRGRAQGLVRRIDRVAQGLSTGETELVEMAIDQRLMLHGLEPVFSADDDEEVEDEEHEHHEGHSHTHSHIHPVEAAPKPGRNDPCPCGSGKKYKKCCGSV